MRSWSLSRGDPMSLELACDARLVQPDYANDHIWEVRLAGGEPPALSVETTFGLRARQMRLLARFGQNGQWSSNPDGFAAAPVVSRIYPNYLAISFSPLSGIDADIEYWVPESHALAGRIQFSNHSEQAHQIDMEWIAILLPVAKGEAMAAWQQVVSPVMKGQAGDIWPVFFITGGPLAGNGTYPSLILQTNLQPGEKRVNTWALASEDDPSASFELARQITARPWEAELARIERINAGSQVEIHSGRPDWDAVFAMSQKTACTLWMGPEQALPQLSFVAARRPDFGYSPRGDGSDYQHMWNGQTALSAHYLTTQALPVEKTLRQGLVDNFLAAASDGVVDMKPGLADQRARFLCQPWLCQLAGACHEQGAAAAWIKRVYPGLRQYLQCWLVPAHSGGSQGLPVWNHLMQTGFEDHPVFSRAGHGGSGLDITTVEDPALFSLLILECRALLRLAEEQGIEEDKTWLEEEIIRLKEAVQECWDDELGVFLPRDRTIQRTARTRELFHFYGSDRASPDWGEIEPLRLLIHLKAATENTRSPRLSLHGAWREQAVEEEITARSVFWVHNQAWITSQNAFTRLDSIEVRGMDPRDEVIISSAGHTAHNLTSFLPLLAGVCTPGQVERMAAGLLSPGGNYSLPYGMPFHPDAGSGEECELRTPVPWNTFVIGGLHEHGQYTRAGELFTCLMDGIATGLTKENRFRANYCAAEGGPRGDAGVLEGLAPLGLFLQLHGIRIYSPWQVLISSKRSLSGLINVQYQGMTIEINAEETLVTFPDGQKIRVDPDGDQLVSLLDR